MRMLRSCHALAVLTACVALGPLPAAPQALPKPTPEVRVLVVKALAALDDRDPKEAVRLSTAAMAAARARRDGNGEGDAARVLFQAYTADEQPRRALEIVERYRKTLRTRQHAGDRKGTADTLAVLGTLYALQRRWQQALETYEQELALRRALRDRLGTAWALVRIGWLDTSDSRLKSESFQKALAIFRAIGNRLGEAEVLDFAAEGSLGQPQKTLEYLQKSLQVYQAIGDRPTAFGDSPSAIGVLLRRIGDEYNYRLAQPQRALEYYQKALPLLQASGDRKGEGSLLSSIGEIYKAQPQQALDYYLKALPITQASGNHYGEARTLIAIADVYQETGKPQRALEYYQKALVVCPLTSSADLEPQASFAIGDVYSGLGQPQEALAYYQRTVALWEKLRSSFGNGQSRTSYLASRIYAYHRCLQVLVQLGKEDEAFALAQKTKARSLLDLLTSGRVDLSSALNPTERREEQELLRKANALNVSMVKEGVENQVGSRMRYEALKAQLKGVESELSALADTLYARHPGLAQSRIARTATAAEIGQLLPDDAALLEYVVVSGQDVRVFVVRSAGGKPTLSTHQVSADYAALRQDAAEIHAACADPRRAYSAHCQKLYAALVLPVEREILGKKRLIICPDGALWDVPFAALLRSSANEMVGGRQGAFLGERFEISYAYSATGAAAAVKLASTRKAASKGILVAANPAFGSSDRFGDLKDVPGQRPIDTASRPIDTASRPLDTASRPLDVASRAFETVSRTLDSDSRGKAIPALSGTQREADALLKLFPDAKLLTGTRAQESTFKARAGNYRYLHLATHGFVNDGSPLLSCVVLAKPSGTPTEDGFLTAREIYGLNLNAEMTVLSACNTARGENRTGEGVIGLTWALFVAGCPTQVVSQWAVDDASTAMLMARFYENVRVRKMGKAQALQEAESWLRGQGAKYSHPYYWAPFVLNGAWQ